MSIPLVTKDGRVLLIDGKAVTWPNCCCGDGPCCGLTEADTLEAEITANNEACPTVGTKIDLNPVPGSIWSSGLTCFDSSCLNGARLVCNVVGGVTTFSFFLTGAVCVSSPACPDTVDEPSTGWPVTSVVCDPFELIVDVSIPGSAISCPGKQLTITIRKKP